MTEPEAEFMNVKFPLRFQGIILRVLRLEVSVYSVYVTNQFLNHFCSREWGDYNPLVDVTVNSKEENYYVSKLRPRIRPQERQR
jgi:hypothetical protein